MNLCQQSDVFAFKYKEMFNIILTKKSACLKNLHISENTELKVYLSGK